MGKLLKKVLCIGLAVMFAVAASSSSLAYTVKSGDSLSKLSKATGVSIEEIMRLNNISNRDLIFVGQELNLGEGASNTDAYKRVALTKEEEEAILSLFDAKYYAERNSDVVNCVGNDENALKEHFLTCGLWEGRQPNAEFNVNAYASIYDDVKNAFQSDNLGKQVKNLYLHYVEYGKTEGREATIDACLEMGRNVYYYGAYDDNTEANAKEHLVATVNAPAAAPSGPVYTTFEDACNHYIYGMIVKIVSLYEKYNLQNEEGSKYAFHKEYLEKEITTANMAEWLIGSSDDTVFYDLSNLDIFDPDNFYNVNADFAKGAAVLFENSIGAGYPDLGDTSFFADIPKGDFSEAHINVLVDYFEANTDVFEGIIPEIKKYVGEDDKDFIGYDLFPAWIEDPVIFVLSGTALVYERIAYYME